MRLEPTSEEKFAFALLITELGVSVDSGLEQRAPGQVDALLTYPNGDQSVVEVTILCDPRETELWRLLQKRGNKWHLEGSQLWWTVGLHPKTPLKQFNQYFREAFALHEQYGAIHPDVYLPRHVVASSPALQWFEKHQLNIFGHEDVTDDPRYKGRHSGTVNVTSEGRSGAVGNPEIVPRWLSEQAGTAGSQIRKKLDKLAASGITEQHLYLLVDYSAPSYDFTWIVGDEEEMPTEEPLVGSASHLWLVSTFSRTYLRWSAGSGWSRRELST
ncbi:hypothetical protein OHS18_42065 [Amycolatopsis sp. NBC_00355]|uniref:hypothetical protein n=1 Tax=Amycolatopsis sp. NBC_00355 TaxID=2975957 RepID=UPI002E2575A7